MMLCRKLLVPILLLSGFASTFHLVKRVQLDDSSCNFEGSRQVEGVTLSDAITKFCNTFEGEDEFSKRKLYEQEMTIGTSKVTFQVEAAKSVRSMSESRCKEGFRTVQSDCTLQTGYNKGGEIYMEGVSFVLGPTTITTVSLFTVNGSDKPKVKSLRIRTMHKLEHLYETPNQESTRKDTAKNGMDDSKDEPADPNGEDTGPMGLQRMILCRIALRKSFLQSTINYGTQCITMLTMVPEM